MPGALEIAQCCGALHAHVNSLEIGGFVIVIRKREAQHAQFCFQVPSKKDLRRFFSLQNENPVGLDHFWITKRLAATIQLYAEKVQ